jgi:hypothetical protein
MNNGQCSRRPNWGGRRMLGRPAKHDREPLITGGGTWMGVSVRAGSRLLRATMSVIVGVAGPFADG